MAKQAINTNLLGRQKAEPCQVRFAVSFHDGLLTHEQQARVTVNVLYRAWSVLVEIEKSSLEKLFAEGGMNNLRSIIQELFHRGQELEFFYSGYRTAKDEEE